MSTEEKTKSSKKRQNIWDIFDIAEVFILCTAAIVIIFSLFARVTIVEGESMEHTLHNGDFLVVSDLLYTPKQGDIVVVHDTSKYGMYGRPLVKRVIATGGQTLDINFDTWTVTVDGEVLDESDYIYLAKDQVVTSGLDFPYRLNEGEVFVMGDNRNHSGDSRSIGPVHEECIVGKVILRVYPFGSFGTLYK